MAPVIANGDTVLTAGTPQTALTQLSAGGWVYARVDSAASGAIYATLGPRVLVGAISVTSDSLDVTAVRLRTREGEPLDSAALALDLADLLAFAHARGFADARADARPAITGRPAEYTVDVRLREGTREPLAGVVLVGASRAMNAFALRASGLGVGLVPQQGIDLREVRQRLEATGAFRTVGSPAFARNASGGLVVSVPVEEGPPGLADFVLGYLPASSGASGQLVGSGRIELDGPFGGGRSLRVALDRDPGLSSRLTASFADPFVLGLPIRAAIGFEGEGRDSTYSRQRLRVESGARLGSGLEVGVTVSGESVQPGRAGARIGVDGRPGVRRSEAYFAGVALRYAAVDNRRSPRKGVRLQTLVEQGIRARAPTDVGDPTRVAQQRFDGSIRGFVPLASRLVGVLGADAEAVLNGLQAGSTFDEGELVRLGGAQSLRGYDEEVFAGSALGRLLAEGRFLLGGDTYALAFIDLGVLRRPSLAGEPAETRTLPGYGVGAQLETGLGLVGVTYALNPELPFARGKVHVALRLGL